MDGPKVAFLVGLVGGGALAAYLAYHKGRELTGRGKALAQNLAEGGADLESYLVSQGTSLASEVERIAREEVERSARQSADAYMANVYGLTPGRIESFTRIGEALEGRF